MLPLACATRFPAEPGLGDDRSGFRAPLGASLGEGGHEPVGLLAGIDDMAFEGEPVDNGAAEPLVGERLGPLIDAYAKGAAVKALARQYDVAPKTIRRVLDAAGARDVRDILKELDGVTADVAGQEQAPEREQPHTIDVPGLLAEYLNATEVAEIREALRRGRRIPRGQGYSVRVSAPSRSTKPR